MKDLMTADQIYEVPLSYIYADEDFNCRTEITEDSVMTLAQSIEIHGLQTPIQLQSMEGLPDDKPFRIIAGHRRFAAVQILKHELIKATVVKIINEQQAKLLNLSENIDRKNLTPYEEAMALANIFPKDTSMLKMAEILKRSKEWCRRRLMILKYPPDLRLGFHTGLLGIRDALVLDSLPEAVRIESARRLMANRQNKETNDIPMGTVRQRCPHRSTTEIKKMRTYLLRKQINGLLPKLLNWVLGITDTPEIKALTREAEKDTTKALYLDET